MYLGMCVCVYVCENLLGVELMMFVVMKVAVAVVAIEMKIMSWEQS